MARYRKRKVLRNIDCGTEDCVIDLPFGRIAVLICHDIEHQDILQQVRLLRHRNLQFMCAIKSRVQSFHGLAHASMWVNRTVNRIASTEGCCYNGERRISPSSD